MPNNYKIILIGPMGAGKTTLGKKLAHKLNWNFVDIDQLIVEMNGVSIAEIFEKESEKGFRKREHLALKQAIAESGNTVLACGGGVVLLAENRSLIMSQLVTIFLDISIERQIERIKDDKNRPLVQTENLRERLQNLRDERLGLYEGIADFRIETDNVKLSTSFNALWKKFRDFCKKNNINIV